MLFPFFAFAAFLIVHLLVWRLFPSRQGVLLIGLLAIAVLAPSLFLAGEDALYVLSVYGCLLMLYLHLYVGIDRSVSLRILGELVQTKSGMLSFDELHRIYPPESMFTHRLNLMVKTGWLQMSGEKYRTGPKAAKLIFLTRLLRRIYSLKVTG